MVQIRIRGILARKKIMNWRDEEMEFLGMIRPDKPQRKRPETARYEVGYGRFKDDLEGVEDEDPFVLLKSTQQHNKWVQRGHQIAYEQNKVTLKDKIKEDEGPDMKEKMLRERREWVIDQRSIGKPIPTNMDGFHKRFEEHPAYTPE